MSGMIKVTYGEAEYWMDNTEASRRTVAQIESGLQHPTFVKVTHQYGSVHLAVSIGVPMTVEYVDESPSLDAY